MARVKKIKLILDDESEFPILGISSARSDHSLAWELNTHMDLSLQKASTCFLLPNKNKEIIIISFIF